MKKHTIIRLTVTSLLFFAGCNTFFEDDISDETVKLLSPLSGISTDIATQNFWWEKIENAEYYHFQIVSPSFDSTEILLKDTVVTADQFNLTLFPSRFEWRIRAENSAFQTGWSTGKLTVFSTLDLTRQRINLISPGLISGTKSIRFQWDKLYNAKTYSFIVYKENWDGVEAVSPIEGDINTTFQTLNDGKYVWGVKGKNDISETLYSKKELIMDSTPPIAAELISPADSSEINTKTVAFTWDSSDATSGVSHDTLKIFSDKTLKKLEKTVVTENKSAEITFSELKSYYWTVRSVDKAGNVGMVSGTFMFTIK